MNGGMPDNLNLLGRYELLTLPTQSGYKTALSLHFSNHLEG